MSGRARAVMAVEVVLFLLPATVLLGLIAGLHYVSYPVPEWQAIQLLFDVGMLLTLGGIVAAWRLVLSSSSEDSTRFWRGLLNVAALIGLVCTGIAVEQFGGGGYPQTRIGFTLLAPAILLVPIRIHLWWHDRQIRGNR
jgi:hypothetical protein